MDLLLTKFTTLQSRVDKINTQIENISSNSATERMEFQISEIRSIMKKFFPTAFKIDASAPIKEATPPRPKLSHSEIKKETQILETQTPIENVIEENIPLTDEEYQNQESNKLRQQMAEKYSAKKDS